MKLCCLLSLRSCAKVSMKEKVGGTGVGYYRRSGGELEGLIHVVSLTPVSCRNVILVAFKII